MGLIENLKQAHIDEPCIKCKAASGEKCRTAAGNIINGKPHADRIFNGNILFEERLRSGYYDKVK